MKYTPEFMLSSVLSINVLDSGLQLDSIKQQPLFKLHATSTATTITHWLIMPWKEGNLT